MTPLNPRRTLAILAILLQGAESYFNPNVYALPRSLSGELFAKSAICYNNAYGSFRIRQSSPITSTCTKHTGSDFMKFPQPTTSTSSSLAVMNPVRRRSETGNGGRGTSPAFLNTFLNNVGTLTESLVSATMKSLRKHWWSFPMIMALIPPYCVLFRGSYASMPHWWGVVNMDYVAAAKNANLIIAHFLGSNIAYAASGAYVLHKFHFFGRSKSGGLEFRLSRFSMLGIWILMAGMVSTIFHSVQALGSYALAESMCYLDHAVAGSATFYFADTCGAPSKTTSIIGALALMSLVMSSPAYAWIHSCWHYLSALVATRWAIDGSARMH